MGRNGHRFETDRRVAVEVGGVVPSGRSVDEIGGSAAKSRRLVV